MCFTEHSKPPEAVANDPKHVKLPKRSRMDSGDILGNTSGLVTDEDTCQNASVRSKSHDTDNGALKQYSHSGIPYHTLIHIRRHTITNTHTMVASFHH